MGVIKLVFETYALLNVDRIGRRPLLLVGSGGLTIVLAILGAALRAKVCSAAAGVSSSPGCCCWRWWWWFRPPV